ncbi:hypothetical protein LTR85_006684 [Meristemomyces frigidus]|nr:hypothetical protein LTR85_006684 [Meristemomyces frigidus]
MPSSASDSAASINSSPLATATTITTAAADDPASHTSLLDLPPELRVQIYTHLFTGVFTTTLQQAFDALAPLQAEHPNQPSLMPPVLSLNRLIRSESRPLYIAMLKAAHDTLLAQADILRTEAVAAVRKHGPYELGFTTWLARSAESFRMCERAAAVDHVWATLASGRPN